MRTLYILAQISAVASVCVMAVTGLFAVVYALGDEPILNEASNVANTLCCLSGMWFLVSAIVAGTMRSNRR